MGQAGQRSPAASPPSGRDVGKDDPRTYRGSRPWRLRLRVGCWGRFPCSAARRGCRGPGWQGQGPARLMDPARSSGAPRSALRDRRGGRVRRGCGDKNPALCPPHRALQLLAPCNRGHRKERQLGRCPEDFGVVTHRKRTQLFITCFKFSFSSSPKLAPSADPEPCISLRCCDS